MARLRPQAARTRPAAVCVLATREVANMYVKQLRARPPAAYSTYKLVDGSIAEPFDMKTPYKKAKFALSGS